MIVQWISSNVDSPLPFHVCPTEVAAVDAAVAVAKAVVAAAAWWTAPSTCRRCLRRLGVRWPRRGVRLWIQHGSSFYIAALRASLDLQGILRV